MSDLLKAAEITNELFKQITALRRLHSTESWDGLMYPIKAILRHKMKEFDVAALDAALDEAKRAASDPAAPRSVPILFFAGAAEVIQEDRLKAGAQ